MGTIVPLLQLVLAHPGPDAARRRMTYTYSMSECHNLPDGKSLVRSDEVLTVYLETGCYSRSQKLG